MSLESIVRVEYALDFGDELDEMGDVSLEDALRNSRATSAQRVFPGDDPDLYKHTLVRREVTITEGPWEAVSNVCKGCGVLLSDVEAHEFC